MGEGSGGVKSTIPSLGKITSELGSEVPQAGANCRADWLEGMHSVDLCKVQKHMLGASVSDVRSCILEKYKFPMFMRVEKEK